MAPAPDTTAQGAGGLKRKSNRRSVGSNIMSMILLIFIPWFVFLALVASFIFLYHHAQTLVVFIVFGFLTQSVVLMLIDLTRKTGGMWYMYLGVLCLLATTAGVVVGFYCYHTFMFQYNNYEEKRMYTNILPSEPGAAKMDAGMMIFSVDTRLDISRSVGYKEGSFYCVAPVMDEDMDTRVEYWAAGIDCCSYRGDFHCDDALDARTKSAAVIFKGLDSFEALFPSDYGHFIKAMKEAEVAYNLAASDNPIFVRWVLDPVELKESYYKSAIGFLSIAVCVFLVVSILLAAIGVYLTKK